MGYADALSADFDNPLTREGIETMLDREEVLRVLETIRPALQSHGGDVQLVDIEDDGTIKVQLQGACHGCPMAQMTLQRGVEARLRNEIDGIKAVVAVPPDDVADDD
jgi:Fe-S cluster biogenesis protein NfuA